MTTPGKHSDTSAGTIATIDFLGDLSGPGGNVFAIFGAIKSLGREIESASYGTELLTRFKNELDADREAGEIEGTYEDVLDKIEVWFGKQSAINAWRADRDIDYGGSYRGYV